MSAGFRDTAQQQMRDAILDAAGEEVLARGWSGLQMGSVAAAAGVSRQTLYNNFANKRGVAQALVTRLTGRFLDGVERAVRATESLAEQWRAAERHALEAAEADPLLHSVLTQDGRAEFLPLLTSEGAPVLGMARERLVAVFSELHPHLDRGRLTMAADAAVRLCLSHVVLPQFPIPQAAAQAGDLVASYLQPAARPEPARG